MSRLILPSASSPFTPSSLQRIRQALASRPPLPWLMQRPAGWEGKEVTGEAATLLTLCNVRRPGRGGTGTAGEGGDGEVEGGVVLTVRGQGLRTHGGEVSLPGGRVDPEDASPADAALREAHEEIGVLPSQVELLGALDPMLNRTGKLKVTPFVGFLRPPLCPTPPSPSSPFAPVDISTLRPLPANEEEVSLIFSMSLATLVDPSRQRRGSFRGQKDRTYLEWDVSQETPGLKEAGGDGRDGEALKLWGMSAWVMTSFLRTVGLVE